MPVSKRTRFEVFKRDDFTCQYCGRQTPDVTLEADHVIPKVEGGGDEFENLVTSCTDCNRGKSGVPLETKREVEDLAAKAELIREREAQIRAYNAAQAERQTRLDDAFAECWDYWFELRDATTLERWYLPYQGMLRYYLKTFSPAEVKEAMAIAYDRCGTRASAGKYFGGIMRRKIAEREGLVRECATCHKSLVLTKDQAEDEKPGTTWWHGDCPEPPQ